MIKRLQIKLITVIMIAMISIFLVLFLTVNVFMRSNSTKRTDELLEKVAEHDGLEFPMPDERNWNLRRDSDRELPPPGDDQQMMRAGRFFYVKVDEDNEILDYHISMMFGFTEEEAGDYAVQVLAEGKEKGRIDQYQYLTRDKDYGKIIVFAERTIESQLLEKLTEVSIMVMAGTTVLLFVLSFFFARWAVWPVQAAFDKQKRFIADASHELKTPLTIISANADVLENEIGVNSRVAAIRSQSERMNELIGDLLELAHTDEQQTEVITEELNLSQIVLNTTLEFESRAFEEHKGLHYEITPGINIRGDRRQLKQVAAILIDNALNHSRPEQPIEVTLEKADHKVCFAVYNRGEQIAKEDREKIFDRFYRSDQSRSRETGGFGLGLAIAKSIVEKHKGKISAENVADGVRFTVKLPGNE